MSNRYYDRENDWRRNYGADDRTRYGEREDDWQSSRRAFDDDRSRMTREYDRDLGSSDRFDYGSYERSRRYGRDYGDTGRRSAYDVGGYVGPFGGYESRGEPWRATSRDYRDRTYRDRDYREHEHRGLMDRIADTISSWFGDDDAERRLRRDETRQRGEHRGRGPKGYKRSDERIREDVSDRLADHAYIDASDIEVTVSEGVVSLTGTVGDRATKRLAEDLAEQVSGVSDVHNQLRVNRPTLGVSPTPATPVKPTDKTTQH